MLPQRASVWAALMGCIVFILIAADVVYRGRLQRMDMPIARWIVEHRPAWTMENSVPPMPILLASYVTDLGSTPLIVGIALIVGVLLAISRRWRWLAWGAIILSGEPILNLILKQSFALPRPTIKTSVYILEYGYTFPSGHTMAACVTFGILAVMASRFWPRLRFYVWGLYGALALIVGTALLYIGVHYLTDILAAYAISACWLGLMYAACRRWLSDDSIHLDKAQP